LLYGLLQAHVDKKPSKNGCQKTIDQKKRAVITRPFGREATIVASKCLIFKDLSDFLFHALTKSWV
jgi:hypothetical protein